jgi:hypothetical protein
LKHELEEERYLRINAEKEFEEHNEQMLKAEKEKLKAGFELALKKMRDQNKEQK